MQALAALSDPGENPDAERKGSLDLAPALRAIHEARDVPPRPAPPRHDPISRVLTAFRFDQRARVGALF